MSAELLLGIDIGTSASKGVLVTPEGDVVARATRDHACSLPAPGRVEHDAEAVWWGDVLALCGELVPQARGRIAAVGFSGIGPCVVPCDGDDRPLRPAILYGVDTRAEHEIAELDGLLGAEAIFARTGSSLSSQSLGPKLAWLRRHEPDVYARTRRWHMASSFAVARLTGEWVLDRQSASQCNPLYDLERETWDAGWADATAPGLPLPALAWPGEIAGTVHARGAEETGIPAGTPVVAGTIDAWAEALSVGVRRPGDLMLMYGSTMFYVLVTAQRGQDRSIWNTAGVDPGSLTMAAGMATSGSLTAWLRELYGEPSFDDLVVEAGAVAAGSDGLLMLPYFAGERTPILDPRARGTITGLTLRHGRGHLYRAALESIAYGTRHNLEAMAPQGGVRAVAVGGGTQGQLWTQIMSDVTGLRQEVPEETIGACYGDALLAAEAVGLAPFGTSWVSGVTVVEPSLELRPLYDELYAGFRALHPATRDIQHQLAALQLDA